jgi:hypothetical protein
LLTVAAPLASSSSALALAPERAGQPSTVAKDRASQESTREWYGTPIVISDVLALGALFGGTAIAITSDSPLGKPLALAGLGAYLVGGPLVHIDEKRLGPGVGSLSLRLLIPVVGAATGTLLGALASSDCRRNDSDSCVEDGMLVAFAVGSVAGLLAAAIVDSAVLARKPRAGRLVLRVVPVFHPEHARTGLSLCGGV